MTTRAEVGRPVGHLALTASAPSAGISATWIWGLLAARSVLALGLQVLVALVAVVAGAVDPWRVAADWWLGWLVVVNIATLWLLRLGLNREGRSLRELYAIRRATIKRDLAWLVAALLVAGPIAFVPNIALGQVLWGSSQVGSDLSFRALPVAAVVVILVTFPIVHGAAELPTYFGYVMPRLTALYGWRIRALIASALVLSTQHVFLPLLFDWRFLIWRGLMFLGFALWIGFVIHRRPGTLPFLAVAHGLLDASLPLLVLQTSL